ncbi:unnamed protein product [Eruca vesicaria subsp. sativa]|uniref:PheRS DNA binding domain-containing protein n=1 Tax=Eruca vesicaria subsp. sativa TaxID=29727 RepID=A0ABC8JS50_ERUVS|nr:unnamed protein product [Eruca vesicaria subsp. sativa]
MSEAVILWFLQNKKSIQIQVNPQRSTISTTKKSKTSSRAYKVSSTSKLRYHHHFRLVITDLCVVEELKRETLVLPDDGKKYAAEGSPDIHFFSAIPEEGSISKDDLEKMLDPSVFKTGSTQAAKKRWVAMGKQVSRKELDQESLNFLKTRKLIVTQGWTGYADVEKGPNYASKKRENGYSHVAGKSWNSRSITSMLRDNILMLAISIPFLRSQLLCPFAHKINKFSGLNFIPRSLFPSII